MSLRPRTPQQPQKRRLLGTPVPAPVLSPFLRALRVLRVDQMLLLLLPFGDCRLPNAECRYPAF